MSVGNGKNVSTPYNLNKNSINKFNYLLSRQRSLPAIQVNQQQHIHLFPVYQQRLVYGNYPESVAMANQRNKHASIEIYRPPNIRFEGSGTKLNVHAKEFNPSKQNNKSRANDGAYTPPNFLMRDIDNSPPSKTSSSTSSNTSTSFSSKATSSSHTYKQNAQKGSKSSFNLQRAKSSGNMLTDPNITINPPRVQFKTQIVGDKNDTKVSTKTTPKDRKSIPNLDQVPQTSSLKRSKSLSAADALKFMEMEASFANCSVSFSEYYLFPKESHNVMKQAVENVNMLTDKQKMTLARYVMEHVIRDKKFSHPVAKLSLIIMENENNGTYLDSLLNTCQMFYQKKDSCLNKSCKFNMFVTFLTEMYTELKRSRLQLKFQSDPVIPPNLVLLLLLSRCCQDILSCTEMHSVDEIECLFFALTSVGRDLEMELPEMLDKLYDKVKEVFLKSSAGPEVKKILLQLIELKAAKWQLPVSALGFYYPKSSN